MQKLLSKIVRWAIEKAEINYLYFSLLLLCISGFILSRFLLLDGPLFGIPLFFMLYALGQAALEVGGFVLIAYLLKRRAPSWIFYSFISVCFGCLLFHFTDFMMGRLMDASASYPLKYLFGFGISHIWTSLQAINMNPAMIGMLFGAILLMPTIGILLYLLTRRVKPALLSLPQIALFIGSLALVLFLLDLCAIPYLTRSSYAKYQKTLPFGRAFLSPPQHYISLPSPLAPPRDEKSLLLPDLTAFSKPNIYLFVIETLRKDFVNQITAPALTAFGEENIQFPFSFANANCTNLSWFAIFHSDVPFHWAAMRDNWKHGSVPLQLLKKIGYKIRVYASADLKLFGMDELIFGQNRALADHLEEYAAQHLLQTWEKDLLALQSLERDLQSPDAKEGNLFLVFLDSTHSEYSFPDDFPLQFEPVPKKIDYFTLTRENIEPMKNRYRNSIAFIDSLVGRFFAALKHENLYDDAIIAITGDHGEEFFEEGALFHGTHLNHYQTSVPLFLKFQNNPWPSLTRTATHMDLFPSILHHLTKTSDFSALVDGQSIFAQDRWPYRIAVLQNGPDTPSEFTLSDENSTVSARFVHPRDIYNETTLEILSENSTDLPNFLLPLLKKSPSH